MAAVTISDSLTGVSAFDVIIKDARAKVQLILAQIELLTQAAKNSAQFIDAKTNNVIIPALNAKGKVCITSPPTLANTVPLVLPEDNGLSGYVLQNNGYGVTSWVSPQTSDAKTLSLASGTQVASIGNAIVTTNANPVNLYTFTIPTNTSRGVSYQIHAYNSTDNESAFYSGRVKIHNKAGTIVMSPIYHNDVIADASLSLSVVTAMVDTNVAYIRATGVAGKNITWTGTIFSTGNF